ncbi:alpha/beta hydrolase [uncultured Chitinophaga sp.]|uniref:alpha/beta fold hydrolase n=1 Tax=uncultured Chitinophaga sp. TaxID=339340 RepID=UPI0025D937C7|nr:alpha/beta hydrolase [uncultured Chitinophaga sp.]
MNAQPSAGHYAKINGLDIYYELHGSGQPLVLLHGGGSTIESNYGRILPVLAKHFKVIAVELQAHGHTKDRGTPLSFEQDADDVAALLKHLNIGKASVMGFSNGGTTTLQFGIRHPQMADKLVVASAIYNRAGVIKGFFDGFEGAKLEWMPKPLAEAYLKANNDPKGLQTMFDRDVERMKGFKDIPDALIKGIQSPVLVISGDKDVATTEHAVTLSRLLPGARLAILPSGHGDYIGEICAEKQDESLRALVTALIVDYLQK